MWALDYDISFRQVASAMPGKYPNGIVKYIDLESRRESGRIVILNV